MEVLQQQPHIVCHDTAVVAAVGGGGGHTQSRTPTSTVGGKVFFPSSAQQQQQQQPWRRPPRGGVRRGRPLRHNVYPACPAANREKQQPQQQHKAFHSRVVAFQSPRAGGRGPVASVKHQRERPRHNNHANAALQHPPPTTRSQAQGATERWAAQRRRKLQTPRLLLLHPQQQQLQHHHHQAPAHNNNNIHSIDKKPRGEDRHHRAQRIPPAAAAAPAAGSRYHWQGGKVAQANNANHHHNLHLKHPLQLRQLHQQPLQRKHTALQRHQVVGADPANNSISHHHHHHRLLQGNKAAHLLPKPTAGPRQPHIQAAAGVPVGQLHPRTEPKKASFNSKIQQYKEQVRRGRIASAMPRRTLNLIHIEGAVAADQQSSCNNNKNVQQQQQQGHQRSSGRRKCMPAPHVLRDRAAAEKHTHHRRGPSHLQPNKRQQQQLHRKHFLGGARRAGTLLPSVWGQINANSHGSHDHVANQRQQQQQQQRMQRRPARGGAAEGGNATTDWFQSDIDSVSSYSSASNASRVDSVHATIHEDNQLSRRRGSRDHRNQQQRQKRPSAWNRHPSHALQHIQRDASENQHHLDREVQGVAQLISKDSENEGGLGIGMDRGAGAVAAGGNLTEQRHSLHAVHRLLESGVAQDENAQHRATMEDAHFVDLSFFVKRSGHKGSNDNNNTNNKRSTSGAIFGVCDGHGGADAALYARDNLKGCIQAAAQRFKSRSDTARVMRAGFLRCDSGMARDTRFQQCGSTCAVCWVRKSPGEVHGREIVAANVGDAQSVLAVSSDGGTHWDALPLSFAHVASDASEQSRIRREGGSVFHNRVGGMLAVTRALGDHFYKDSGVTADPFVTCVALSPAHKFVILACDGLWDVMNGMEAVQEAAKYFADGGEVMADRLVREAITRGSTDNITVIVVRLHSL